MSGQAYSNAVAVKDVAVAPERLERWLAGFAERHGATTATAQRSDSATPVDPGGAIGAAGYDQVIVSATDGAVAECGVPFPPLATGDGDPAAALVEHALRDRAVGVILVRRGGYAAGAFEGTSLVASKVGSRHVQGRTAAGGQSQQRFARRRANQAREAFDKAAEVAARVLSPYRDALDAVVLGGDKAAIAAVMAHPELAWLGDLITGPRLDVPDPKHAVLAGTPDKFRAVRIRIRQPT